MFKKKMFLCSLLATMMSTVENNCKYDAEIFAELLIEYNQIISNSTEDKSIKILRLKDLRSNVREKQKPFGFSSEETPYRKVFLNVIPFSLILYHSLALPIMFCSEDNDNDVIKYLKGNMDTPAPYYYHAYWTIFLLYYFYLKNYSYETLYALENLEEKINKKLDELREEKSNKPCQN